MSDYHREESTVKAKEVLKDKRRKQQHFKEMFMDLEFTPGVADMQADRKTNRNDPLLPMLYINDVSITQ